MLKKIDNTVGESGGYVKRTSSCWSHVYALQYYREIYKYAIITIEEDGNILACAFVGETTMRDYI